MTTHVLIALDDSAQATTALEHALDAFPSAHLTVLHVIDPGEIYTATGLDPRQVDNYERIRANAERRATTLLERAHDRAAEEGVDLDTEFRIGGPANAIVAYAENNDVDHIVIGSHGRSGASRILLGSVAETVGRRSPVPVTIVR
jgi:nucleotide-binding universal stress UspA family protein